MKLDLKSVIAASLVASFFAMGNILIFGLVSEQSFPWVYSLFVISTFLFALFLARRLFESRTRIYIFLAIGLFLLLAATYSASAAKSAIESTKASDSAKNSLKADIDYATQKNSYYVDYANYFKTQIESYQTNSENIQEQIIQIQGELAQPIPAAVVPQVPPQIIIQQPVIPNQRDRYDDDGWDDDEWDYEWEEDYDD